MNFGGFVTWCLFRTPKRTVYEGSFTCNGAAAATLPKGTGYTVRRTDVGTFVVTLSRGHKAIAACHVSLQQAAAANDVANLVSHDLGDGDSPATLTIETQSSAGTAADLAAGTVHFTVAYSDATFPAPASTSV